jgi:alpha-mannosidase
VGYAVYQIRRVAAAETSAVLKVTSSSLENARYRVTLNAAGDVASIFDKLLSKELLSAPVRLAISNDAPTQWPAWNMDFDQEQAAPRAYVSGPAKVCIVENGPARVAIEVSREAEGSRFAETVRLSAGDAGNRVEFSDIVDWRTLSANLKAVFPLTAGNPMATYNWEIGTVQRPTAFDRQFEVASHHWIDLTDKSGAYGTTILTGVKNGSDKRDEHTIRLTLIRTPGAPLPGPGGNYPDQLNQDWGHHQILYGLAGHAGDWREGETDWQAYRLSTPLMAFTTARHRGVLGRSFSLVTVDNPHIRVLALKKAEMSNEIVLRMVELDGRAAPRVQVKFAGPILAAREVNGQELPVGPATVANGVLETSFKPYQPRTFALRLGVPPAPLNPPVSKPVVLKYDLDAASNDDTQSVGGFDRKGDALPAEMLPTKLNFNGIQFNLAPAATGKLDAVIAQGQTIQLPTGDFDRIYVLAASAQGDQKAIFRAGACSAQFTIENWGGFIGQWDTRVWKSAPESVSAGDPPHQLKLRKGWEVSANHAAWNDFTYSGSPWWSPRYPQDYLGLARGYIKPATLAWYASHHHTPDGLNEPYQYSYLFAYSMELPPHATTLTLPKNDNVHILAISVAHESPEVSPVQPLYDTLKPGDADKNDYIAAAQ